MLTRQLGNETAAQDPSAGRRTLALLGSLCLFLSAIEYLIPKPLPFMRIGLANLPLLLGLDLLRSGNFFLLALIKVLGQGILSGSLFSYVFLFSAAGTFSSAALMYVMRHIPGSKQPGFTGIGCAGAMVSNSVQLLLARFLVFGDALRFLLPPFLASGFICGTALGLFCEIFCRRSRWYAKHSGKTGADSTVADNIAASPSGTGPPPPPRKTGEERRLIRSLNWDHFFNSSGLFIAGVLMALFFLFNHSLLFRILQFIFFCFLAWLSGKKNNPLITVFFMVGIVFFNLLAPYGKILTGWGPLRITQGSLLAGLERAVTLEGLVMLSGACVRSGLRLPGSIGSLLGESFRILERTKALLIRGRLSGINRGPIGLKSIGLKSFKLKSIGSDKSFIEGIDRLLMELESTPEGGERAVTDTQSGLNVTNVLVLAGMTGMVLALTAAAGL